MELVQFKALSEQWKLQWPPVLLTLLLTELQEFANHKKDFAIIV